MSASIEGGFEHGWANQPASASHWDELPTDGSHAWLGLILILASSVVAVRGLCWLAATMIRLFH